MNFKRILALIFCVVAFSTMLVGCEEDVTQKWLDYYKDNDIGQPRRSRTLLLIFTLSRVRICLPTQT